MLRLPEHPLRDMLPTMQNILCLLVIAQTARAQFYQVGFKAPSFTLMSGAIDVPRWTKPGSDIYIYAGLQATKDTQSPVDDEILQPAMFAVAPHRNQWRTSTYFMADQAKGADAAGALIGLVPGTHMFVNIQRSRPGPKAIGGQWKMAIANGTKAPSYKLVRRTSANMPIKSDFVPLLPHLLSQYNALSNMDNALFTVEIYKGTFTSDMAPVVFRSMTLASTGDDGAWCSLANLYHDGARVAVHDLKLEKGKGTNTCHIGILKLYPVEMMASDTAT